MFCPECGREIPEQSVFCGYCGSSLDEKADDGNIPSKTSNKKSNKQNKRIIVIGISSLCIIAICIALYFVLPVINNRSASSEQDIIKTDVATSEEDNTLSTQNDNEQNEIHQGTEVTQGTKENISDNIVTDMSEAEKRDLNIFFSNFSEAFFDYYKPDEALLDHNYFLIGFAFTHNLINNSEKIIWQDEKMGILAADVNKTLERFLGVSVPLESCATTRGYEWVYEDNAFWSPAASGESYDYFSVVTDMKAVGDGTYIAHYNKYYAGYDGLTKDHYTYSIEKANNECEFVYQVTAHIRPKVYNNKNTYEVISLEHE